jgi:hypothetical protein
MVHQTHHDFPGSRNRLPSIAKVFIDRQTQVLLAELFHTINASAVAGSRRSVRVCQSPWRIKKIRIFEGSYRDSHGDHPKVLQKFSNTQMLHVWNIYQHFPKKSSSFVGKYTIILDHDCPDPNSQIIRVEDWK